MAFIFYLQFSFLFLYLSFLDIISAKLPGLPNFVFFFLQAYALTTLRNTRDAWLRWLNTGSTRLTKT